MAAPALFLLQFLTLSAWLFFRGGFEAIFAPDTETYTRVAQSDLWHWQSLAGVRTLGYPLFMKGMHALWGDPRAVPVAQFIALNAAVVVFYRGLRAAGAARGPALAVAGYLLLTGYLGPHLDPESLARQAFPPSYLLSEPLSGAVVIAWAGLLLAVVAAPTLWRWLGLTCAVFLAYQIRPSNLGLVALTPLLGWLLGGRSRLPAFLAASLLPFLSFCTLRLAAVGHFGLVSFGGANSVCVTGQLLTEEMLPRLTPESRSLAEILIAGRTRLGWRSPRVGRHRISQELAQRGCDQVLIGVAVPGVAKHYLGDIVSLNRDFARFSLEVIRLDPVSYAYNFTAGMASAAREAFLKRSLWLPLALFALLAMAYPLAGAAPWAGLSLIAVSYFLTLMAVTVAVQFPFSRYVEGAMVLLPAVPLAGICSLRLGRHRLRMPRPFRSA